MSDWLVEGGQCLYRHRAPYGLPGETFRAIINGFTPRGRVRILAYDHPNKCWYPATVSRYSLRPPAEHNEPATGDSAPETHHPSGDANER